MNRLKESDLVHDSSHHSLSVTVCCAFVYNAFPEVISLTGSDLFYASIVHWLWLWWWWS